MFTGNKLTCDCRLSWLLKLQNETRSKRLRASINRLNCVDAKNKITAELKIEDDDKLKIKKQGPDYDDDSDEISDKYYDDAMQDQENDSGDSKVEYRRRLTDIPKEFLACSNRLVHGITFSPPTQDEVKYYKSSSSTRVLGSFSILYFLFGFSKLF